MPPPKKKNALTLLRWLLLLCIPTVWCVMYHFGLLGVMENQALKLYYHVRGERAAPVKVRYVDVDTRAIQQIGERPWNRGDFGLVAQTLLEIGKAKAVGFDFVFSDFATSRMVPRAEITKRNLEFARIIHGHPEIVLGAQYSGGQARAQEGQRHFPLLRKGFTDRSKNDLPELPQYPLLGATYGTIGLIDVDYQYGGDEIPRWVPLFADTLNPTYYHLSLKLALIALGLDESAVRRSDQSLDLLRPNGEVVVSIPLREKQLLEVNWFSHWLNPVLNPRDSVADVILYQQDLASEKPEVRAAAVKFFQRFEGALVLIGPVDPLLQDTALTPIDSSPVPKVGLHGNLIKTIVGRQFLRRISEPLTVALTFLLTIVVAGLAASGGRQSVRYKVLAGGLLVSFIGFALLAFKYSNFVLPLALPLGAVFTTSFAAVGWQLLEEEKQKGRIKGMFGTYVSPQLVDNIVNSGEEPQLGGHEAEITPYFSDIQGFSKFSEILAAPQLVELMNEYLTACTDIVLAEGGALDKYIGDAVVAMFGGLVPLPDHAYRACVASQLVHLKLAELREKWRGEGDKWPELVWHMQSRIGLNSGPATVGNMGSAARFNYTMMGDTVNLAARMESGAKAYGVYTMVAESTKVACVKFGGDRVVFRYLDKIVVKGRTIPVPIYEIMGLKEDISKRTRECLDTFGQAMALYVAQDWDAAEAGFRRSAELEPNQPGVTPGVETNPSLTLIARCQYMRAHPPGADWNGVWQMKEK